MHLESLEERMCPSTITLNYFDSGWWDSTDTHDASNKNYIAGQLGYTQYRDYFVFDLTNISQPILGAELQLFNPDGGFSSDKPSETYSLFDVSTPISQLTASGLGHTDIFIDLGTGTNYGSHEASAADNGQVVTIPLNANAVSEGVCKSIRIGAFTPVLVCSTSV